MLSVPVNLKKNDSSAEESLTTKSINGVALSRYVVFLFLLVGGCALDLITKQIVFAKYFHPGARVPISHWWIEDVIGIQTSTNQGALWGAGQGMTVLFVLLSFAAFAGIIYWLFINRAAISLFITVSLGLISGGILGNLYDRMGLWHDSDIGPEHVYGVRDWIHFRWEGAPGFLQGIFNPWPNFNIADSLLVCGAVLLVVHAFFLADPPTEEEKVSE